MLGSALAVQKRILAVAIAALTFAIYVPALRNGFVGYDDGDYVVNNPHVNTGLSRANTTWALSAAHANNWHPLTWLSHSLDAAIFGLDPRGHHFTSLALHAANTSLMFLWLAGATGQPVYSAFVALGFGLHPLHVESVAWIAERKDVLSTFFLLLTLLAYSSYVRKPGLGRYALVFLPLTAGLLSKQMLVTVPFLLLLLDFWPLRRTVGVGRRLIEKLPLVLLCLATGLATLWAQRRGGAVSLLDQLPLAIRLENAVTAYFRYLGKVVWPSGLSAFYPFPSAGIPVLQVAMASAGIVVISFVTLVCRSKRPWLLVGWGWFLLTLLPVIGIIQVGMQSMADRYMYVPMTGLLIAAAWEVSAQVRFSTSATRAACATAAIVLALWSVGTWMQIPIWHDGVTLFRHALEVDPDNFVAHDNLGVELDRRGQSDEALEHYRATLRLRPGDRNGEANFAMASFAKGERLTASGKFDEALSAIRDGIRYRPRNALAHTQIGRILSQGQSPQLPAAIAEFRAALAIDPQFAAAHMGLAVAMSMSGHPVEARTGFENVLRLEPGNVEAHYDLGLMLATLGDAQGAFRHFEAAVRLNPGFGNAHVALAEMDAAMGRYGDAWREVQLARAANAQVDPVLVSQLQAVLARK